MVPWRQPWASTEPAKNLISKKEYRGINWLILNSLSYANPYFLTYKQAQELGGHVRKGEHGCPVAFWKEWEIKDKVNENGEPDVKIMAT